MLKIAADQTDAGTPATAPSVDPQFDPAIMLTDDADACTLRYAICNIPFPHILPVHGCVLHHDSLALCSKCL
jgi:hypothetical protein